MSERGGDSVEREAPPRPGAAAADITPGDAESAAAALAALEEPRPRRRMTLRWIVLIVLALVVVIVASLPLLRPLLRAVLPAGSPIATAPAPDFTAQRLAAMEQQLATIERQLRGQTSVGDLNNRLTALSDGVDALQQQVAQLEQEAAGLSDFDARITKLEQKQADLTKAVQEVSRQPASDPELRADVTAQGKDIAALGSRMDALRDTAQSLNGDARKVALVMALNQLGEAAAHNGSFTAELKAVRDLAGQDTAFTGDPAFATLQSHAADGVTTLPALQAGFAKIAGTIVSAGAEPAGDDWMSRTLARLGSIVTIRRTGEVAGNTPEAIVARTERRLAGGDLAAAVQEIGHLNGRAAAAAADWLARARANLAVAQAVETLRTRTLAGISTAAAGQSKSAP